MERIYAISIETPADNVILETMFADEDDAFYAAERHANAEYPGYEKIFAGSELKVMQYGARVAIYKILRFSLKR